MKPPGCLRFNRINATGATKFGAFGAWILKYVIEHTTNVNFQGKGAAWDKLGVDGSRKVLFTASDITAIAVFAFLFVGEVIDHE